jgi:4,5-dihydroxyphthalate decarboxylase
MVQPLRDGRVKPNNIELDFVTVDHPGDLFLRNLKFDEFDVSEMGIPWTIRILQMNEPKRWDWGKLPIFLSRGTGWTNLYVNAASGIHHLGDLRGKRICVPEYNTSMCLWLRVVMQDFFGINPKDNVWYVARTEDRNQGKALGVERDAPEGIDVVWLTNEQTPDGMLERGEIDAAIIHLGSLGADSIDRYAGIPLADNPKIRKLIPNDGKNLLEEFFRKTGMYQINHHVIVQNRILRENPWVAMELFTAFQQSKTIALENARRQSEADSLFKNDNYPIGVNSIRKSFDRYIQALLDGDVIKTRLRVEDVYFSTTLGT